MEWYIGPLRKYADFKGRATRREYWLFLLGQVLIGLVVALVHPTLYFLFLAGTITPMLAVYVRRLHDTNRSGWWYFITLVPLLGNIVMFVFLVLKGTSGDNDYGPDPLVAASATVPTNASTTQARSPSLDSTSPTDTPESGVRGSEVSTTDPKHASRPVIQMRGSGEDRSST